MVSDAVNLVKASGQEQGHLFFAEDDLFIAIGI
jgi:hypothetical protein